MVLSARHGHHADRRDVLPCTVVGRDQHFGRTRLLHLSPEGRPHGKTSHKPVIFIVTTIIMCFYAVRLLKFVNPIPEQVTRTLLAPVFNSSSSSFLL